MGKRNTDFHENFHVKKQSVRALATQVIISHPVCLKHYSCQQYAHCMHPECPVRPLESLQSKPSVKLEFPIVIGYTKKYLKLDQRSPSNGRLTFCIYIQLVTSLADQLRDEKVKSYTSKPLPRRSVLHNKRISAQQINEFSVL